MGFFTDRRNVVGARVSVYRNYTLPETLNPEDFPEPTRTVILLAKKKLKYREIAQYLNHLGKYPPPREPKWLVGDVLRVLVQSSWFPGG